MKSSLLFAFCLGLGSIAAQAEKIKIVAAENFYGSVAEQIAGADTEVFSILSNPNQDPHEFTTDASTARAVADADIVIYNGAGYDSWMDKLLSTPGKADRKVICMASLLRLNDGDNPHLWYSPLWVDGLASEIAVELTVRFTPPGGKIPTRFQDNLVAFRKSTQAVMTKIFKIAMDTKGTKVTATEPVFGYMCEALGFKMLNYDFQVNVMNDTEPSAAQTAEFEKSLRTHQAKLLFYNSQVTDPTTERLKKIAQESGIPIIGVTETQPPDQKTYAEWMLHELDAVEAGLKAQPR